MCISFIIGMNNEINESINILHWFVDTCDIVGHSFIIHPMTAGSWWTVMSVRQYWSAGHVESFDLSQVILSHVTKADQIIGFSLPVTRLYTHGLLHPFTLHVTTVCGVRYPFSQLSMESDTRSHSWLDWGKVAVPHGYWTDLLPVWRQQSSSIWHSASLETAEKMIGNSKRLLVYFDKKYWHRTHVISDLYYWFVN